MDILRFLTAVFVTNICVTAGQQIYSSFVHILPTGIQDQMQLYYHLSWKQQNLVGTCVKPACLKVYRMTNKTAQFFGRFTGFQWSCHRGCTHKDTVTDMSHFMFSEVNSYAGVEWEAGDETVVHTFRSTDDDDIELRFQFSNGTHHELVEDMSLNLRTRSDTKRPNVSPAVAVLPIYRTPLGCSTEINLFPYDGDGDNIVCRWNISLPVANLDKKLCKISITATLSNGYVAGQQYRGSVYIEDYSSAPVNVTRNGISSFTSGPFSSTPVMFTVHVATALANPKDCLTNRHQFEPRLSPDARSYAVLTKYSSRFTTLEANVTILTVGNGGVVFNKVTNASVATETADWTISANDTGVYKTCVMIYSSTGVPGETRCDTVLAAESLYVRKLAVSYGGWESCTGPSQERWLDTDACTRNDTCKEKRCGHCTDYWRYHICSYNCNDDSLNIGLIVGTVVGSVILLAAIVTGICLYLRYIGRKKTKVADVKEGDKQQIE